MDPEALLELERHGWQSLCDGTGSEFYGELMTEDAVMLLAGGLLMDRETVKRALADAPRWDSFEIEEPRIIAAGFDGSILAYRAVATRGDEPPFVALMASVYVDEGHGPRLVSYQQTPVAS